MNKKGFTLVELLAVIVILSLLALLTGTAITKMVKDSKEELSDAQKNLIKAAAETWGAENLDKLPSANECKYITLQDLQRYGIIDSNVIDPETSEKIQDLNIKITTTGNSNGLDNTEYEVGGDTTGCTQISITNN